MKLIKYRSKFETEIGKDLKARGIEYEYETKLFRYLVEHKYRPDFVFPSVRLLVEAKGYFTPSDRAKSLSVLSAIHDAGWELAFLFQRGSNKIHRSSPTTYGSWCDAHNFRWAEGKIPDEWLT